MLFNKYGPHFAVLLKKVNKFDKISSILLYIEKKYVIIRVGVEGFRTKID